MKNSVMIFSVMLFSIFISAQSISVEKVPENVKSSLSKNFSGYSNVKWEKENENFEATFKINQKTFAAVIESTGVLIETEEEIKIKDLPSEAISYIQKKYPRKKIKEAAKITDSKGIVTFEAEVGSKDLIFDKTGVYIKTTAD